MPSHENDRAKIIPFVAVTPATANISADPRPLRLIRRTMTLMGAANHDLSDQLEEVQAISIETWLMRSADERPGERQ